MAERVVDGLEAVEVDGQHGERLVGLQQASERRMQRHAIGEPRQRIAPRPFRFAHESADIG